jgi:hypothetical protein
LGFLSLAPLDCLNWWLLSTPALIPLFNEHIIFFLGLFFDFLPSFFDLLEERISEACLSSIPFRVVCSNFLFLSYLEPSLSMSGFLGRNFGMRVSCISCPLQFLFIPAVCLLCQCENSSLSSVCIVVCKFLILSFQVLVNLCRVVCVQAVLLKCLSCDAWIEFSFLQFCQESYAIGWGFSAIITARVKCNF